MDAPLRRALDRARAGDRLDSDDLLAILACGDDDLQPVLAAARDRRDERAWAGVVTYSRKVFIPLTRLCRYRCSYCTFVTPRASAGGEYLTLDEVLAIATQGRSWGCTEALFTLGESPEHRHPEAARWLADHGYASTIDYVATAAREVVLRTGLLPHVNAGAVTEAEMAALKSVSASQGVMMEQLTDRLLQPGEAHAGAAGKAVAVREEQLAFASATKAPFTTGLLIGIGETLAERAETIRRITAADAGQIQEVIVQNFRAKLDTPMRGVPDALERDMWRTIAAVRLALPARTAVQAPPNLTPETYGAYLDAGIDDWGGVSPVTPDHVNPEMPWPSIDELAGVTESKGFTLRQRLPVYPAWIERDWIADEMWRHVLAASDGTGLAREERWHAGEGWVPVLRAAQSVPKRRALAMVHPEQTATDVSAAAAEPALRRPKATGYGAPPEEAVGFDDMLPDLPGHTLLAHERIDGGDWLEPYTRPAVVRPQVTLGVGSERDIAEGRSQRFAALLHKASAGERLDHDEVVKLLHAEGPDLAAVIAQADQLRASVNGDTVTYVVNRNVTYTNFCHTGCGFCGFARPLGHDDGYYFEPEQIATKAAEAVALGATEVCVQGGIHPHNTGEIYFQIAKAIKAAAPDVHLHGFSPLEITVGARTLGLELDEFLPLLKQAGVDSIPGTAAEILDDRCRPQLTPQKLDAQAWLDLMRVAHTSGLPSTSTIMFGHLDDPVAWATHLLALRDLQAETGGFTEFVLLPFVHHRSPIFMRGDARTGPTWREIVRMHAVSRIVLHPLIPNIQASWVKCGADGVEALLRAGVNDFGGTLMEEHISRMAGASHGLGMTVEQIESHIRRAGRVPAQRSTTY